MNMSRMAPRRRSAARLAAVAFVLGAASASSQAAVVKIDAGQSSVTYTSSQPPICDPSGNCSLPPAPQTFALSGSFNVVREVASTPSPYDPTTSIYFTRISFDSVAVDLGGADVLGFSFPSFAGLVNGTSFTGSDDPCFFSFGGCVGGGLFNNTYAGDFDGHTFFLSGVSPQGFFDSFTYQIVATLAAPVATVPEPGTLACVAVAGAGWAASRRRRGRRDIQ
ncbi:MAG: PEP-CTERM sorting domain-containing protein [Proteobacteria bacterium]|nr:PEP-CTERM sorting domain-containing protein [Pseudomonadota bacterium]